MPDNPATVPPRPEHDFEDMLAGFDRILNDKGLQQQLLDAGLLVRTDTPPRSATPEPRTEALIAAYWAHREGRHGGECCQSPCFPDIVDRWVGLMVERTAEARSVPPSEPPSTNEAGLRELPPRPFWVFTETEARLLEDHTPWFGPPPPIEPPDDWVSPDVICNRVGCDDEPFLDHIQRLAEDAS